MNLPNPGIRLGNGLFYQVFRLRGINDCCRTGTNQEVLHILRSQFSFDRHKDTRTTAYGKVGEYPFITVFGNDGNLLAFKASIQKGATKSIHVVQHLYV